MEKIDNILINQINLIEQASAPATPAAGNREVYYKTDGLLYSKNSAGVETVIGGSAAWTDFSGSAVLVWDITPGGVSIDLWKYRVINGICYFAIAISATDGNNATTLNMTLPVNPALSIDIFCKQYIGSVLSMADSYIISGPNKIFISMQTATDGQNLTVNTSGFYPV